MKFIIKLVLLLIILIIVSQLEYKGRKIQTYIEEYVRSFGSSQKTTETDMPAQDNEKEAVVKEPVKKPVRSDVKPKTSPEADIGDKDRKELQNLLEQ